MTTQKKNNQKKRRKKRKSRGFNIRVIAGGIILGAGLLVFLGTRLLHPAQSSSETVNAVQNGEDKGVFSKLISQVMPEEEKEEEELDTAVFIEADPLFEPYCTEATAPSNLIASTAVEVNGTVLGDVSEYVPESQIEFGLGKDYTEMDGIISFRGNNFRNSPSYGYAEMTENSLTTIWSKNTGALSSGTHTWTGSGWTGQPLIVRWPKETKEHMNMYDWAKADDELVEVIYACMDGYVYFLDLQSGEDTRDPLNLGYTFKGSGALDPRGYPILYVGAGYDNNNGKAKVFIVNLLDCSVMYTFGDSDPFSQRGTLSFFDSSALVDAETDTLIYPGENGILYLLKLNTVYDPTQGALSISPGTVVKWRYYGTRTNQSTYWLGMESSAAIYKGYLFIAENGGNLMCLELNTLQLVWVQDILDDSNSTPVLSMEDGHLYLYVSTSFHLGWRSSTTAPVPIWKIDAENGEVVWRTDYECYSMEGVSGGVQSTIAVGENNLADRIYVTVSRTGQDYKGVLACLNKTTGEVQWEHEAAYAWSSPVCVYHSDGSGKVLYCSSGGYMYLLNGETGEVYDTLQLDESTIEASPAVYNQYAAVGTRGCKICGVELR